MKDVRLPIILTVREVSIILRIHRPKVYDLLHEGIIEGFKLGADWRIQRASVERLLGAQIPQEFFKKNKDEDSEEENKLKVA